MSTTTNGLKEPLRFWFNGTERVIAEDEYEARDLVVKCIGCYPDEVDPFDEVTDLSQSLTVDYEGLKVTMTLREWIEKEGRCLLSSTELP